MRVKARSLSPGLSIPALEMTSQSRFWICAYRTPMRIPIICWKIHVWLQGLLTTTDMAATIDIMVA